MKALENTRKKSKMSKDSSLPKVYFLVLYNDNEHSIDYVVNSLMAICGHNPDQALQCTLIIHNMGSYEVKKGSLNFLTPMKKALSAKRLKATIK